VCYAGCVGSERATNGAERLLDQLEAQGVECLFASPIAVMAPIWEDLVRRGRATRLRYFRCRHELLAVSLASGYWKATDRPQVVFLPTNLGVQNGSMGLRAALQEHVPMTVLSIDSLTWGEDPTRDPGPEWPSLLSHAAGPARSGEAVVKWAKEVRVPSDLVHEVRRAGYVATAIPRGPTLLEVPFDLLVGEAYDVLPPPIPPARVVAPTGEVEAVVDVLAAATNPIVVTEHGGRTAGHRRALLGIAERLGAPVFEFMTPAFHNFPRSHRLHGVGDREAVLGETDAILLAGANAPWHPPRQALAPGCAVIHVDEDPLRPRSPYWGYVTTHTLAGDLLANLTALADGLRARPAAPAERAARWAARFGSARAEIVAEADRVAAAAARVVPASELFRSLHRHLPEDAICVDEIVAQGPAFLHFLFESKPFEHVRGWHGGLGQGLGTALGAKVARPDRLVVCVIGDGAWHYNPVPAALGFSQEYGVPILVVLCDNRQYASQTWNVLRYYPDGAAVRANDFVGSAIEPTPDYVKQVEAYGGAGERVEKLATLEQAVRRGIAAVTGGQTYLLDVFVEP
jgi:acetolactate synthase I/II/III large subunit